MLSCRLVQRTLLVGLAFALFGCTSQALQSSTIEQGSTVPELLEQMVLDNLEMVRQDPSALPWHVKITGGQITIQDELNVPTYSYTWPIVAQTAGGNSLGQRQWTLQWTVSPVVDTETLQTLQSIYQQWASPQKFDANFLEGPSPPDKRPYGRYGSVYVWPRPGRTHAVTDLILATLTQAKIKPGEKPALVIGR